jgi:hypothetical protein
MGLVAIVDKLATLGAGITGVTNSYDLDQMPSSLQPSLLPAILHFPQGGKGSIRTMDACLDLTHKISVVICYAAAAQGTLAAKMSGLAAILDLWMVAIQADPTLGGTCIATPTGYGVMGRFPYGDVDYISIEIALEAQEYIE